MGVPAFYKWLTLRYAGIDMKAFERSEGNIDKIISENYINMKMPDIDNLYLDMNGIIHPCAHPTDRDAPTSLNEIFNAIFIYVDKLVRLTLPKRLLFLAIDGVAPRAKMNQQRSRRFRAALEAQERKAERRILEKEWKEKGLNCDFFEDDKGGKQDDGGKTFEFDSNVITPGTEFLKKCSEALKEYVKTRLNNDPLWKNLTVIFSDSSVPGEGEHKILDFIRRQRTFENYDPNRSHCIYGADADLIMLSLIIHEPRFYVIRESLDEKYYLICEHCGKHGHSENECNKITKNFSKEHASDSQIALFNKDEIDKIEFSLVKIGVVREYLEIEFEQFKAKNALKITYDFERIIDDFVFLCFLVGNDFLPHMPSLKIREGAIDALIYLYKKLLPELDDYLTNGKGELNLKNVEILFMKLSKIEDEFFKQEIINKQNAEEFKKNQEKNGQTTKKINILDVFNSIGKSLNSEQSNEIDYIGLAKEVMSIEKDEEKSKQFSVDELKKYGKNKFKLLLDERMKKKSGERAEKYEDKIEFGKPGWKDRYYIEKFKMWYNNDDLVNLKQKIKQFYIEGLCWVFSYYFNGCCSWSWFYPFHYAPFASDLTNLTEIKIKFELSSPFNAFEQLLSVLPPYSKKALPNVFQKLMIDPLSPISDFYPSDIKLDINNQPFDWMGVNLIPFIDADRIKAIVKKILDKNLLSKEEIELGKIGNNILISRFKSSIKYVNGKYKKDECDTFKCKLTHNNFKGLYLEDVEKDETHCLIFTNIENRIKHKSNLLNGAVPLKKEIMLQNLSMTPKIKFKGKTAIDICRRILGYDIEEIEGRFRREEWDRTYNNNRGIEYDPAELQLLRRKRYQENLALNAKMVEERRRRETKRKYNDSPVKLDKNDIKNIVESLDVDENRKKQ